MGKTFVCTTGVVSALCERLLAWRQANAGPTALSVNKAVTLGAAYQTFHQGFAFARSVAASRGPLLGGVD
jgi:hypothetical protein